MTSTFSKAIFFSSALIITALTAFAQEGGNYERPPEHVVKSVRDKQPYYAGMTKDQLYKVYSTSSQKSYYAEGIEEWILFVRDDNTDDDVKNAIVFYLKDGVVSGWKKKDIPITPEERLKIVSERSKMSAAPNLSTSGGGNTATGNEKARRPIYNPPRFNNDY